MLCDRHRGALLGLAVGDALGTTLEFKAPGTFKPVTDLIGGGPFGLEPGQWTDDTSMALCLAESLIEKRSFDPKDQMDRYCRWWKEGYLSSTGTCFDIGATVRKSLESYLRTGEPFAGSTDPFTAGNGSLMRLAPVPLAFRANFGLAIHNAGERGAAASAPPDPNTAPATEADWPTPWLLVRLALVLTFEITVTYSVRLSPSRRHHELSRARSSPG